MPAVPRAASVWPSDPPDCAWRAASGAPVDPAVMSRATFPAAARLLRPTEFAAGLAGKRVARGAYFVVTSARVTPDADGAGSKPIARLGLIIAKRFAQRASTRNALKRVLREAFRARRLELEAADYVVRLHRRIEPCSLSVLKSAARAEADTHFARVVRP